MFLVGVAGLAGCATNPPVAIDREAMARVKRVAVPTVAFPGSPDIAVTNTASQHFGLIGAVAGAVVRNNRIEAIKTMLASQRFDAQAQFDLALSERLVARNLAIVRETASPVRRNFLETYRQGADRDAVLDVVVLAYGFLAHDDRDTSPYRPTVLVRARLVDARDRSVMMQDAVTINGVEGTVGAADPGQATFSSFSQMEARPDLTVASLRAALTAAADGVVRRLG
ncbi:hypothetical protein ACE7GA_19260 [Roseomonas sp. CCTCC AB2023176]|uniref:hypothetical protein n=1 Tax=Roseomonas sp. CCTCC AB2023176 TaxID=3342640 RepID=UPI0035DF6490